MTFFLTLLDIIVPTSTRSKGGAFAIRPEGPFSAMQPLVEKRSVGWMGNRPKSRIHCKCSPGT